MREIELPFNCNLEKAVEILIEYNVNGESVYCMFNGNRLRSDDISLDGAYKQIVGCSYGDFKEKEIRRHFEYEKREREHKLAIPKLTEEWCAKGHEILEQKYWKDWDKIVPVRLGDLYHGMELGNCLDIVKKLNNNCPMEEAANIIDSQGHSGMSYSLVRAMVKMFCDRGEDFYNYFQK